MANTTTKVVTSKVRFSYVHVFEPWSGADGQEAKYSVQLLIRKDDKETMTKIKQAIEAAKQEGATKFWGGKVPPNINTPIHDGDTEKPDHPEYAGCYYVTARSRIKPGIVDRRREPILDQTEFYSGCYGRASITFRPYNQAGNRGIRCELINLQKLEDGEPLGSRTRPEDDFDAVEDEEDFLG